MNLSGTVLFDQIQSGRCVPVTLRIKLCSKLCSKQRYAHKRTLTNSHHTHALSPAQTFIQKHVYCMDACTREKVRGGSVHLSSLQAVYGCWRIKCTRRTLPSSTSSLSLIEKITIVRGVNSVFWPLMLSPTGYCKSKREGRVIWARSREEKRQTKKTDRVCTVDFTLWSVCASCRVHMGTCRRTAHTCLHNRGRNAVCHNLWETHLSRWTGASHDSSPTRSIFISPPFRRETFVFPGAFVKWTSCPGSPQRNSS